MKTKLMLILSGSLLFAGAVAAQTATPEVTKRQVSQHARIKEGEKNGELTRKESANLKIREAQIRHHKRAAKNDGVVTADEKAKLNREENRTSRAIYRKKHNEVKK